MCAQLLQMLYSVRSGRLLMEEMDYNILFRWFVGLNLDDSVWDATVFTKNRDTVDFVRVCRNMRVAPHAAQNLDQEVAALSILEQPNTQATPSVKRNGSASKNALAG